MLPSLLKTITLALMTSSYEDKQVKSESNDNDTKSIITDTLSQEIYSSIANIDLWSTESTYSIDVDIEIGDQIIKHECKKLNEGLDQNSLTDWLPVCSLEKEKKGTETPELIKELLNRFEKFVSDFILKKHPAKKKDRESFVKELSTFAIYSCLIQIALQAPPNEVYFSPNKEGRLFSSCYFEAAERFHEINNKAFSFFEKKGFLRENFSENSSGNEIINTGILTIKRKIEKQGVKTDKELVELFKKYSTDEVIWKKWVRILLENKVSLDCIKKDFFTYIADSVNSRINCQSKESGFRIGWQRRNEGYFVVSESLPIYNYSNFCTDILTPPMFLPNGEARILMSGDSIEKKTGFLFKMEIEKFFKGEKEEFFFLSTKLICYNGKTLHLGKEYEIVLKYNKVGLNWVRESEFKKDYVKEKNSCRGKGEERIFFNFNNLLLGWQNEIIPFEGLKRSTEENIKKGINWINFKGDIEDLKQKLMPLLFHYTTSYILITLKENEQQQNTAEEVNLLKEKNEKELKTLENTYDNFPLEILSQDNEQEIIETTTLVNSLPSPLISTNNVILNSNYYSLEDYEETAKKNYIKLEELSKKIYNQRTISLADNLDRKKERKEKIIEKKEEDYLSRWLSDKEKLNDICCKKKTERYDLSFIQHFLSKYDTTFVKENFHDKGGHRHWTNRKDRHGKTKESVTISCHGHQKDNQLNIFHIKNLLEACKEVINDWEDQAPTKKFW